MKKLTLISVFVLLLSLFLFMQNDALRGVGGRGGGGGGGARGGGGQRATPRTQGEAARINQNMNRTPSMSPPLNARQAPSRIPQGSRPSQLPARQNIPTPQRQNVGEYRKPVQQRPTLTNQARSRSETRQFTQVLRNVEGNTPRKMQQPKNFNSTLQNQIRSNAQASSLVGNHIKQRYPDSNRWFNDRFFDTHGSYGFFGQAQANWWGAAGWTSVASWLPWDWQSPYYYYYPGYSDTEYPPASDLYLQLQAEALAQPAQGSIQGPIQTDEGSWLALGVFAVGASEQDASYTNFFIQLAVDNSGDLAGTFYNAFTDEAHPLGGYVDKGTQQAVWKISDNPNSPVMMTGIYNLTQDMTPVQVYFENEVQQWVLVRVNK